eukprot:s1501_g8.t1
MSQPHGLPADDAAWDTASGVFLRNIPAKCTHMALTKFLHGLGLDGFKAVVARHPNGKSRGYAHISFAAGIDARPLVAAVSGKQVPGFNKVDALCCEPITGVVSSFSRRVRNDNADFLIPTPAEVPITQEVAGWCQAKRWSGVRKNRRTPKSDQEAQQAEDDPHNAKVDGWQCQDGPLTRRPALDSSLPETMRDF